MRPRLFLAAIAVAAMGSSMALGQQSSGKIPRVGILSTAESEPKFEPFRRGLHDLGYVEGRNIALEFRFVHGDYTAFSRLTEELIRLPVDVIVTDGASAAQAAAKGTRTIPIVMGVIGDPMALGLVDNIRRPGGNITGFTLMSRELNAKRVDLAHAAFPEAQALTVLLNPSNPLSEAYFRTTEKTAISLGLTVRRVEAASPQALSALHPEEAFGRAGAPVLVLPDLMFWNHRREIIGLAEAARVPALYPEREYADDGGLMAYGPVADTWRRAADYVDRILRGTKPGDLPVQEPAKFDFVVNLKTAKELGVAIPPLILGRADEVIE